jgi:hypothetical protein
MTLLVRTGRSIRVPAGRAARTRPTSNASKTSIHARSMRSAEHPYLLQQELESWVGGHVELTGALVRAHERPWGSVWRVPVRGGLAWMKVCAPSQVFEPRLTAALAGRWPSLLPEVLACDGERGRLLLADCGERLGFGAGPDHWLRLLPAYANLQRGEAGHAEAHRAAGVPDRRLACFPSLYERLLAHELPLSAADYRRLCAFAPAFARVCDELAAAGVAETMQHDDLHGNNVYPYSGRGRILDWGDACISHPFLTLFVTFLHLEEREGLARGDHWFARLRDAYLEPWGRARELRETFELAQRLGPFAHLFKEQRLLDAIPESEPYVMRGLPDILDRCIANAL